MRYYRLCWLTIVLFFARATFAVSSIQWVDLPHGLQRAEIATSDFNLSVVRFEAKRKVQVVVLDVYRLLNENGSAYPAYSLDSVFNLMKPKAIINGGFSKSMSFPFPSGIAVVNGTAISQDNPSLSGIFCVKPEPAKQHPAFVVLKREEFREGLCEFAIQGNPIVVENGKVAINASETDKPVAERSLVAIDDDDHVYLIHSAPAHLASIGEFLARPVIQGGLGLRSVLNLSGDMESGLIVYSDKGMSKGHVNTPIPSVIAIFEKDAYTKRLKQLKTLHAK